MKILHQIIPVLLFFLSSSCFSQTAEQQEAIDKALKMRDSILQGKTFEEMLKEADEQTKRLELDKKTTESETKPILKVIEKEDKYWKNTLASDTNKKLKGWSNGTADIVFNYYYDSRNDKLESVKVGEIKTDGSIELNPTIQVPKLKPLKDFKNSNNFSDIHDSNAYQYINKDSGFKLNSYLLVYQNDKKIGVLTVGNSAKVTLNLLTPGDLYFGDEGYMLSWVYVDKACSIKANENWIGDLSNTGNPLIVETNVSYDLSFNPGWNLVKTEVIGTHEFPNAAEEDRSRYKNHVHRVISSIPMDATYFFRKSPQY